MDLGKRQRKKISYNEANLARERHISTSDSEYHGSEADGNEDDEDGSGTGTHTKDIEAEGEEGKKVGVIPVLHFGLPPHTCMHAPAERRQRCPPRPVLDKICSERYGAFVCMCDLLASFAEATSH